MAQTTILSLPPEIFMMIGSYLDQRSLAQCVLVCQKWTSLFTPSFWEYVQMNSLSKAEYFTTPDSLAAFTRNQHHTRILETTDSELLLYLFFQHPSAPRGLQHLTFLPAFDQMPYFDDMSRLIGIADFINLDVVALLTILDKATNIRRLTIGESCFWNQCGDIFLPMMAMFPTTTLERLHISFDRRAQPQPVTDDPLLENKMAHAVVICANIPPFVALKELSISADDGHISLPRMAFLVRCGNLECVRLSDVDEWFMRLVPFYFRCYCPRLTSLHLTGTFGFEDRSIAMMLLSSVSGWKVLRLPFLDNFGQAAFKALMESAPTLEILVVENWGVLKGECFLDLLCGAGKLRRLQGFPDGEVDYDAVEVSIHAYDAFMKHSGGKNDLTWALGPSMEFLQMQIKGVPRPDVACRLSGGPLQLEFEEDVDVSRRYDVQRWIYEQLGRMTGLQDLLLGILEQEWSFYSELGVKPGMSEQDREEALLEHYTTFHYMCLEFSLESGLELLGGLKELKVLDIRSTAHRIGVPELEWMSKNWPKLKEVKGLFAHRGWTGDEEGNKAWEAAVNEWMAAHPDGIGCSYYS